MSPPRIFVDTPLAAGKAFTLPEAASRHAQVLRLQPGDALTLFDGRGGQWAAAVAEMGRRAVTAHVHAHDPVERELPLVVVLAVVMPAGDRMDFVVEKATELGAAAIAPLISDRSVLRLTGERAAKRVSHWQALAVAACEQCGRNRVPAVQPVRTLGEALQTTFACPQGTPEAAARWLLGWRDAQPWAGPPPAVQHITLLSGPEGGFTEAEEAAARAAGFATVCLGPRTLRADTAPLAALSALALATPG
jgi:16S rRNA (uracil1498-N3)-methyltransferase